MAFSLYKAGTKLHGSNNVSAQYVHVLPTTGTVILIVHVEAQADTGQGIIKLLRCSVSWFNLFQVVGKREGIIAKEYTPASEVVLSKRYLCGILVVKLRSARGNT